MKKPVPNTYERTIRGSRPGGGKRFQKDKVLIVAFKLPEYMRWIDQPGNERAQCAFRLYEKGVAVCVKVFGEKELIESLMTRGIPVICQLELIERHVDDARIFLEIRLYVVAPTRTPKHRVEIVAAPKRKPRPNLFTTTSMRGVGVLVERI